MQNKMQHERAKFQNKLNQVQLYSLVNIIMVKIKIEPGIRYFNLLISEKLNMMIQWSAVGTQWLAFQKCIKEINRFEQIFCYWFLNKWYWYFKTKQIDHYFKGMRSVFLLICVWSFLCKESQCKDSWNSLKSIWFKEQ